MRNRSVSTIQDLTHESIGAGFVTRGMGAAVGAEDVDPFIFAALFDMTQPTFPPHPHAGFVVATYMLPESAAGFVNQDSTGLVNAIPPGAIHFTVAGRGLLHEEEPERSGVATRGFQIWADLPNAAREIAPHAFTLAAEAVPVVKFAGAEIRVLAGESNGAHAPLDLPIALCIVDVTLDVDAGFNQALKTGENAFLIVHAGAIRIGDHLASAGQLVRTDSTGAGLTVMAGDEAARFTLFAGMPLRQPRQMAGPMIAKDQAGLRSFMHRAAFDNFGTLVPFALSRNRSGRS